MGISDAPCYVYISMEMFQGMFDVFWFGDVLCVGVCIVLCAYSVVYTLGVLGEGLKALKKCLVLNWGFSHYACLVTTINCDLSAHLFHILFSLLHAYLYLLWKRLRRWK